VKSKSVDPVRVGDVNRVEAVQTPRGFAASLVDMTDDQLNELLLALEEEVVQPNAPGRVRRELDEVLWELDRRTAAQRTRERRQANIEGLRQGNADPVTFEPGVWVHGRSLDERERQDLAAFIRWVVREGGSA